MIYKRGDVVLVRYPNSEVFDWLGGIVATERWDDERLDRLAELVEANSRDIVSLRESIVETNRAVLTTNQNMNQLVSAIQEQQEANTRLFQMLIQEIRGLRAENRRILTHLFDDQPE